MANPMRPAKPVARKGANVRRATADADLGFWNRPVLMNLVADVFYLLAAIMLCWATWVGVQRLPLFPLKQLVVRGALNHVTPVQLDQTLRTALTGNFFTVDLDSARTSFENIPWVRRVELRRRWPDTIELVLDEHQAVAYWTPLDGESRLVSRAGEVFVADSDAVLPYFAGPEDAASRVLDRFNQFERGVQAIGRRVIAVHLSPREAWRLRLDDGVVVYLGRDQENHTLNQRLDRLVMAYPQLHQRLNTAFNTIDMRYPNGLSVRTEASTKVRVDS